KAGGAGAAADRNLAGSGRITGTARPSAQPVPVPPPAAPAAPRLAPVRPAAPAVQRAAAPERTKVVRGPTVRGPTDRSSSLDRTTFERARQPGVVLIGTSTGGPIALQKVVSELKPGFSRPI